MTNKEFDKLFQDKLNNREFAFNPESWKGVEKLLDAKKVAWYATSAAKWGAGLLAAASIVIGVLVYNSSSITPVNNNTIQQELPLSVKSIKATDEFEKVTNDNTSTLPSESVSASESPEAPKDNMAATKKSSAEKNQAKKAPSNRALFATNQGPGSSLVTKPSLQFVEQIPLLELKSKDVVAATQKEILTSSEEDKNPIIKPSIPLTKKQAFLMHHQVVVRLGANIANGFNGNATVRQSQSEFLSLGLHYRYRWHQQWALQTGFAYYERGAINTELIKTRKIYSFGADRLTSHFLTDNMQFAELPIQVMYSPSHRHQLTAGAYVAYLLGTKNTVIQHYQLENSEDIKNISNSKNHMEGFHRVDYGLTLGYEYQLLANLSLGGSVNLGLRDLTVRNAFETESPDYNHQFRVHLNYTIW